MVMTTIVAMPMTMTMTMVVAMVMIMMVMTMVVWLILVHMAMAMCSMSMLMMLSVVMEKPTLFVVMVMMSGVYRLTSVYLGMIVRCIIMHMRVILWDKRYEYGIKLKDLLTTYF